MPGYVLIVDDDPNVTKLIVDILRLLGLEGRTAPNGRIALDMAKTAPPSVVILDLMMPIMDGFTTLTYLRRESYGKEMPVIVLSALADQSGAMERLPGIVGSIVKGKFALNELKDLLIKAGVLAEGTSMAAPSADGTSPAPAVAEASPAPSPDGAAATTPVSPVPESQPAETPTAEASAAATSAPQPAQAIPEAAPASAPATEPAPTAESAPAAAETVAAPAPVPADSAPPAESPPVLLPAPTSTGETPPPLEKASPAPPAPSAPADHPA